MRRKGQRKYRQPKPESWEELGLSEERLSKQEQEQLETAIAETGLSLRIVNVLETVGVLTVGELLQKSKKELMAITNFGDSTLDECVRTLSRIGFSDRVQNTDWQL
jgi:DNA-directed RNA polymerase subunit alpha